MKPKLQSSHLSDPDLFSLAVPPAGEPEALPAHLSDCFTCSRALQEWKTAIADLAKEDAEVIAMRSEQEWNALEEQTIEAVHRTRLHRRAHAWGWALTVAATFLLVILLLPGRTAPEKAVSEPAMSTAELSAQDQADDALLRDVARLARGEDGAGAWNGLVPEPAPAAGAGEETL